jgi:pectinesterase
MRYPTLVAGLALLTALGSLALAQPAPLPFKPDLTVAADGSGDFKTIQAAVASLPRDNHERRVIFVKDGMYNEKVRVDASFVTLRGQSRAGTRLAFSQGMNEYRGAARDNLGQAVLNINGDDFVLENLTVENTHGVIGTHAFAIYGRGDRTVIQDCDVLSQGNDTLSLWRTGNGQFSEDAAHHSSPNGRYYHARLKVRGSVDFICPRGWCYMTDSEMFEVNPNAEAAMWHDGSRDRDMKFVMRNCQFDGVEGWRFARHHHDAMIFVLDSAFSTTMRDTEPKRVIYPLKGGEPTDADRKKNKDADPTNIWGERFYYFNTHRDGGDYAWHKDNLATAPGAPRPEQITAKWTFADQWDPENQAGPRAWKIVTVDAKISISFKESVTVKGQPRLALSDGTFADYASGCGSDTLIFTAPARGARPDRLDFQAGVIVATEASSTLRLASTKLP